MAPAGRWTPVSRERGDLPDGIDAVIEKGLSSRPRNRYQNAQEYLKALHDMRNAPSPRPGGEAPLPVTPAVPVSPVKPAPRPTTWKIAAAAVVMLFVLWLIGTYGEKEKTGSGITVPLPPVQQVSTQSKGESSKAGMPLTPADVNYQGQWFDELAGTGVAQYRIMLQQDAKSVTGVILDARGTQWGTISGYVNGTVLDYKYASSFGNGWGRGEMDSGGLHVQVLVNGVERRTMHRNHLPGQEPAF